MAIVGIHHVQLSMPRGEEAAAVDFYAGLLGIPRVAKPPHLEVRGGCWFESGEVRIHLGVDADFSPAKKAHPALLVEDLDALRARLDRAGVAVADDQPLPGFERFYVSDPFGNRLELLSPHAAAASDD
jgi:catechol 2,3-dioxygenase-like lactoylglutathione lyase family enzyme